jgi:hypothetical protein
MAALVLVAAVVILAVVGGFLGADSRDSGAPGCLRCGAELERVGHVGHEGRQVERP